MPIINKPHALYYNGELIGIITNPDPFGNIHDLCNALSPDEGLAGAVPIERHVCAPNGELDTVQLLMGVIERIKIGEFIPLDDESGSCYDDDR